MSCHILLVTNEIELLTDVARLCVLLLRSGSGSGEEPPTPTQPIPQCLSTQYLAPDNMTCNDCNCDELGALNMSCADGTGMCDCRAYATGMTCNMCVDNFYRQTSSEAYLARCWQACSYNSMTPCQGKFPLLALYLELQARVMLLNSAAIPPCWRNTGLM